MRTTTIALVILSTCAAAQVCGDCDRSGTVDAEARTAINAINAVMAATGLTAAS